MQADFSIELGRHAPALEIPWRSDDPHVRYFDLKIHPELVLQIPEAVAYPELAAFLSRINAVGFPLATAKCDAWSSNEVAPEEEIFGDRKFVSYIDLVFADQEDRCSFEKHEAFARELCRLLSHAPEIAAAVELVIRHCYYHQEEFVPEKSSELTEPLSSAAMGATEINALGNQGEINDDPQADIAVDDELERAKEHDEHAEAKDRDEHGDLATFRTPQSTESNNVPPERKPRRRRPINSVTGFCITAYVIGFGDHDHDPMRRWAIALHLLQNAIVQLHSNLEPKH
jgi:hypothetical protein